MKFRFYSFSCETDVYRTGEHLIVRFYDQDNGLKHKTNREQIVVNASVGYLCLRVEENMGYICGWVDEGIFSTDEIIEEAVEFLINHSSDPVNLQKCYHIDRVKVCHYIEYQR